jgi:TonB family protein
MKRLVFILTMSIIAVGITSKAQESNTPFAEFDRQLQAEPAGWAGDKSHLSAVFDAERQRLGKKFEFELMKYLQVDAEKHYWISVFLEEPSYLHGNKPLPRLSIQLMGEGLSLLKDKTDVESLGLAYRFNIAAAVLSQKLEFWRQAVAYKTEAERLLTMNADLRLYFPAISKEELKIYQNLKSEGHPTVVSSLPSVEFADQPEARVSGGILNGKATSLPMPTYPREAKTDKASGTVVVRIVVDESGTVIWARAIEGHPALKLAAENAAWKAKFHPLILSGKPERVVGVLIFRFVFGP